MIIEIPEDTPNKLEYAKLEIVKQALVKFKKHDIAARYLGCCPRVFCNWFNTYPELLEYRNSKKEVIVNDSEGNERWGMYPDE